MAPMNTSLKIVSNRNLDRMNLRLPQDTLEAIDVSRSYRVGSVSRNTWIIEAIAEKLANEHVKVSGEYERLDAHG